MIFIQSTEILATFELTAGTLMLKAEADATRVAIIASFIVDVGLFFRLIRIEERCELSMAGVGYDGRYWNTKLKADSADPAEPT